MWCIRAKLSGAKLVVIDSRRHRVAESADLFLQIKPGTEALLYGAMAKVIVDRGLMNLPFIKARCRGYEAFLDRVRGLRLAGGGGRVRRAGRIDRSGGPGLCARAGRPPSSTRPESRPARRQTIEAIVNLALLTGKIGKEGAGIFALTEHNNLQGVCDMGMLPDRLPGYRPVMNDAARAEVGKLWGAGFPPRPGLGAALGAHGSRRRPGAGGLALPV